MTYKRLARENFLRNRCHNDDARWDHSASARYARRLFEIYGKPILAIAGGVSLIYALTLWWHDRFQDFSIFYTSARALRLGINPYDSRNLPNLNGPFLLLALTPLTYVPERLAATIWLMANGVGLWISARAISRCVGRLHWIWIALGVFSTQGAAMAVRQGQLTFVIAPIFTFAWLADRDGHEQRAAALLGVACALKPFFALTALYLLWRRGFRAARTFAVTLVACLGVGLFAGFEVNLAWIATLRSVNWQAHEANVSLVGFASRLFETPPPTGFQLAHTPLASSPLAKWLLIVVGCAGLIVATARRVHRKDDVNPDREWASASLLAMLVSPLAEVYYLPVAVGPILLTLLESRPAFMTWLIASLCVPYRDRGRVARDGLLDGHAELLVLLDNARVVDGDDIAARADVVPEFRDG